MYTFTSDRLSNHTLHFTLHRDETPLSSGDVYRLWQNDAVFLDFFIDGLRSVPFTAYRWETPPVTRRTLDRPFEFVVIDAPYLDRPPRRADFAGHFERTDVEERVVDFPNLGGDAWLIVPAPIDEDSVYPHIGAFTRRAALDQQHTLWQRVGRCMMDRCGDARLWLSTAGDGVPWLHVRIDTRPKYYHHQPYKQR